MAAPNILWLSGKRQKKYRGGTLVLFLLIDTQGLRAISMLLVSPIQLISGDADPWRAAAWAGITDGTWREQGSTHNVYLDLFWADGMVALGAFHCFLVEPHCLCHTPAMGQARPQPVSALCGIVCIAVRRGRQSLCKPAFSSAICLDLFGLTMVLAWLGSARPDAEAR